MKLYELNPYIRFAQPITYDHANFSFIGKDCRLFYITHGNLTINVNNTTYNATESSIIFIRGGVTYSLRSSEKFSLISLNFDLSQNHRDVTKPFSPFSPFDKTFFPIDYHYVDNGGFLNDHFVFKNCAILKNDFKIIVDEFKFQKPFFREHAQTILKKMLIELIRSNFNQQQNNSLTSLILDYITNNFNKQIFNKDIADMLNYHEYHLNRIFKKHMGVTIHHYIIQIRVMEAKKLLLNTEMTLSEIAEETGFNCITHFSTQFKKLTDYTPLQYRNNFRNLTY